MNNSGKIFGAILGYLFARFDGAIAGFILGWFIDSLFLNPPKEGKADPFRGGTENMQGGDFHMSLLALSAAVMQSDGATTRSELDYVKVFFVRQFGVERTKQYMLMLRDMLKRQIPLEKVCFPMRQVTTYETRLQLLHYLYGVAHADGQFSDEERQVIYRIAVLLGISTLDMRSIGAMFTRGGAGVNKSVAYEILGIGANATDDEVKKAYRRMALESHPDKVTHLGEDLRKAAEEKFKKIQEAYEQIKSSRGFS
ncbi:MAG TPA: TerB family tellurite resistance protein [Bacteroidia bacterium]|nr:TerB family tellurite resistance protein [Bacteroidia bacterium]